MKPTTNEFVMVERAQRDVHFAKLLLARARANVGRAQGKCGGHAYDLADIADFNLSHIADTIRELESYLTDLYEAMPDDGDVRRAA